MAEAPAQADAEESQVIPSKRSPAFPRCLSDSRTKAAGINYVIEIGLVLMGMDSRWSPVSILIACCSFSFISPHVHSSDSDLLTIYSELIYIQYSRHYYLDSTILDTL